MLRCKYIYAVACAIAAAAGVTAACAHAAPADPGSNPEKLQYSDVRMKTPDYAVPFKRDGALSEPSVLKQVAPGLPAADVTRILGRPLAQAAGSRGPEWDYNLTLRMSASENYLMCQYKVVFDEAQRVKDTVWRRHQCQDIVEGSAPR